MVFGSNQLRYPNKYGPYRYLSTYLLLKESPELLLEDNFGPHEKPGGGAGDGVDANVGLHDEGVGVGDAAVLRLSVNAVDLATVKGLKFWKK